MGKPGPVDFGAGQASGLAELAGATQLLWNFLPSPDSSIKVRPLVNAWSDFPAAPEASPVIGIQPYGQYVVYVTQNATTGVRKLWAWLGPGNVVALSDATTATQLDGTLRPIFTTNHTDLFITGGGAPQTWTGTGLSSRLGGSPPNATHIATIAQRLVLNRNDVSGQIVWTDPGDGNHATWPALNFAEAEASADISVAMYANTNEVFVFGARTTQFFFPDPNTAFSTGRALSLGCKAPYSVIVLDDAFAWLDDKHRFVMSDGRGADTISSPLMAETVKALGTVSDCWGCRIVIGAHDLLLWVFPTEERTLYYDQVTKKWGEWKSWDGSSFVPWIGQSYCYWPQQNIHLVGLSDGTIGLLDFGSTTELGQTVVAKSRTGFVDQGTLVRKLSQRMQLTMKRGATLPGSTAPVVELAYRDDLGSFQPAIQYSLGAGDYRATIYKWSLGMYRNRQWELTFTAAAEFLLASAVETYELSES